MTLSRRERVIFVGAENKLMFELLKLGIHTGIRNFGARVLLAVIVLLLGAALLAASFSGRQPLTVALDVGFSGLRLILLLMTLFWVQELLARDIERKTLYFVLAYPISRRQYLLARFGSAAVLSGGAVMLVGGLLWLSVKLFGSDYSQSTPPALDGRFAAVLFGIWLDLLVVQAFAFLLASLSTTPFLPMLLGLAFALAARGLGPTFDYLRHNQAADPDQARWFGPLLDYAHAWLPDLSRLDWRPWVLYDLPVEPYQALLAALMALAYIVLALSLAGILFTRRNLV